MAFWNSVKRAFGFSPDEETDDEYDSTLPVYAAEVPADNEHNESPAEPVTTTAPTDVDTPTEAETDEAVQTAKAGDPDLPGDLFDAVIKLFNDTLPDFVKQCLSTEQQRQFIYNALDESLRLRLDNAVAGADNAVVKKLRRERDALKKRIEEMKQKSGRADTIAQEMKRVQLSADRQKRALCDRVNDLEHQLSTLQAEKEKILITRTNPAQTAEIEALGKTLDEKDEEIEALKIHVTELEAQEPAIPDNSEEMSRLQAELDRQSTLREQLEIKTRMTDAMTKELRAQLAQLKQELDKAREDLAVVDEIQAQIDKFEDVKKRKDDRIAELQNSLASIRKELESAAEREAKTIAENESLRRTIENNLYNQANSESKLRNEIDRLRQQMEAAANQPLTESVAPNTPGSDNSKKPASETPRRKTRRKARVDENLDNTDWLASPSKKSDPDFGYHEPPHSPINTNDAQLSLF